MMGGVAGSPSHAGHARKRPVILRQAPPFLVLIWLLQASTPGRRLQVSWTPGLWPARRLSRHGSWTISRAGSGEEVAQVETSVADRPSLTVEEICRFATASTFSHKPSREAVLTAARKKLFRFSPSQLTNFSIAVSELGVGPEDDMLLDKMAQATVRKMYSLTPSMTAAILRAFAKLDLYDRKVFNGAVRKAAPDIGALGASDIDDMAFAFMRFDLRNEAILGPLALATSWKADKMSADTLSSVLWSFGQLGYRQDRMLEVSVRELKKHLEKSTLPPTVLGRSLVSLAKLEHLDEDLMRAVSAYTTERLDEFAASSLTDVLWAFATLKFEDAELTDALCARSLQMVSDFEPADISKAVGAIARLRKLATLRDTDAELMQRIAERAVQLADKMSGEDWMTVILSTASVGSSTEALQGVCSSQMSGEQLSRETHRSVSALLWLCECQDDLSEDFVGRIRAEAENRPSWRLTSRWDRQGGKADSK
eukprot:TRINITY_DN34375_c0_g1_i1.p1 TRINITY_DN34375_c0_g1~~TRINITY_DN34375_c0_g1_i1.p1  ORF type:complete len:482 (-),score=101.61 TRINITY_DN34375_c0_g1_i1:67-1512(-)